MAVVWQALQDSIESSSWSYVKKRSVIQAWDTWKRYASFSTKISMHCCTQCAHVRQQLLNDRTSRPQSPFKGTQIIEGTSF